MTPEQAIEASKVEERRSVLTTAQCARALGMSPDFIRGEIRDGRLRATVFSSGRKRARYRIDEADFLDYKQQHWKQSA